MCPRCRFHRRQRFKQLTLSLTRTKECIFFPSEWISFRFYFWYLFVTLQREYNGKMVKAFCFCFNYLAVRKVRIADLHLFISKNLNFNYSTSLLLLCTTIYQLLQSVMNFKGKIYLKYQNTSLEPEAS